MTDNPDAWRHDERTTREPTELRPPEKFAHLPFHFINRTHITVLDDTGMKPRIEPMMWNGHNWWTIASTRTEVPEWAFADGWRYHGPCDPDAITLNLDSAAQVEAAARAICLESEESEDRWFDYEPEAKAAIQSLRGMK